jgi:Putative beta-barrel porin-2, OmpL-like. bbp2
MNFIKKTLISTLLLSFTAMVAQDDATVVTTSATTFGGSADFYYKYDFANVDGNGLTSFSKAHDSFELGMASIEATHKMGKASVFADLGFGNRAKEFTYNDNANSFMIKQLNMTYEFSSKFKVTAGAFSTHLGYELVDAVDNKNYSMSYAFTNGPFFNTGIKAQYTSGKFTMMLGVTNPTDFKTAAEAKSKQKTVIGQLGYVGETGNIYFNFTSGSQNPATPTNTTQLDIVASKKLNDNFTLGFNGTYAMLKDDNSSDADQNWFSAIGYAHYIINKSTSLAYRLEYFKDDKKGLKLRTGVEDNSVIANTLSLNFKEGNFTFIPEFRLDAAGKETFFKNKDLDPSKTNASFLIATTYSF